MPRREDQGRKQHTLRYDGRCSGRGGREREHQGEEGEDTHSHEVTGVLVRCLADATTRPQSEQHGEHREPEWRDRDDEGHAGCRKPCPCGDGRVENEPHVHPVPEEPRVDRGSPEHDPVDLQPILHRPQEGERHEGYADADAHHEEGFECGEEGCELAIHTGATLPATGLRRSVPRVVVTD